MFIKKKIFPLLIVASFINFSCEPDYISNSPQPTQPTDPTQSQTNSIIGKWKKKGITDLSQESIADHYHECEIIDDYVQFFSNGIVNDISYLEDCITTEVDNGTYSITGNILNIQSNNELGNMITGQLSILELSTTSLKVKLPEIDFVIIYEKY